MIMDQEEAHRLAQTCFPDAKVGGKIPVKIICQLWAGMGHVYELGLGKGAPIESLIVKSVDPDPDQVESLGGRRKAKSYEVEAHFYQAYANELLGQFGLRIPRPYHVECNDHTTLICMSKLDGTDPGKDVGKAVISWLAKLHGSTWGHKAEGLQPMGSYWYLDTRPDEHADMPQHGWQGRLKRAARAIDNRLKRDSMECIIHGDPKEANILWDHDGEVAMCDFQYCGKGPPTRDVAYFLCTSTYPEDEDELLKLYYKELIKQLPDGVNRPSFEQFMESYDLACSDCARFMSGWGFWGNDLSKRAIAVLNRLDNGTDLGSEDAYEEAMRREYG